jgi:hypothetical protein
MWPILAMPGDQLSQLAVVGGRLCTFDPAQPESTVFMHKILGGNKRGRPKFAQF